MAKTYSNASDDVLSCIERMREAHYDHETSLLHVTIAALFMHDDENSDSVLSHQGYAAQAMVRITPVRDRKLGVADAVIIVDRANWLRLNVQQRDALIDHELYHLERVADDESGELKFDAVDRPKLRIRKHDHQFGWFDAIAERHGEASAELRQARNLIAATGQLYLDFSNPSRPSAGPGMQAAGARHR